MTTDTYKCANARCGKDFEARTADRARGWARFCSKSCKAAVQERQTGQHHAHLQRDDNSAGRDAIEDGWDGHKNAF